jgi:putative FmdB family regulatory protein
MPIYEYACKSCKHTFDALQKMNAALLTDCPECGESELKKLLSAPNFRLKGSGWYETDFKKDNRRNLVEGSSNKADSGATKDESGKNKSAAGGADKSAGSDAKGPATKSANGKASGTKKSD